MYVVFLTLKDIFFEFVLFLHSSLFMMMTLLGSFMLQYNVVSSAYISILKTQLTLDKSCFLLIKEQHSLCSSELQFGFKKGLSTT